MASLDMSVSDVNFNVALQIIDGTGSVSDASSIQGVTVDDTDIGNGKVLQYNATSGNLEYEAPAGGGDMLSSVYDPNDVNDDAFNMDNMVEGTDTKIMTSAERTKLSGIEASATADQTGAEIKTLYEAEDNTNAYTDAEKSSLETLVSQVDQEVNTDSAPTYTGVQFTTGLEEPTRSTGLIFWDDAKKCISVFMDGSEVTLQIGREGLALVRNSSGVNLTNGTAVSMVGASGGKILIDKTDITDADNAKCFLGILTEDVDDNANGECAVWGKINGIDTVDFNEGDVLYVGETAGTIVNSMPGAPNYIICIGRVDTAHAVNGVVFLKSSITPMLTDISDVNGGAPSATSPFLKWSVEDNYWTPGTPDASEVTFTNSGSPTVDTVKELFDYTMSAGVLTGGLITDGGSGTVNVSEVECVIKSTNSATGANTIFKIDAQTGISLTDESVNYILVNYNSGSPTITASIPNTSNGRTIFALGRVFREGTDIDILDSGVRLYELQKRIHRYNVEENELHFLSGAIVSETGTRNIALTSGVMYAGLNRIISDAIDTAGSDTFEYYYYNGAAWIESDQTQIDNVNYNDTTSGLSALTANRYGVHWVYKGDNSRAYVIYGQGNYTLAQAQAAQPTASLPSHVEYFGVLRAKIIIQKNSSTFLEIESVTDTAFTAQTASAHNELTGLQGGLASEYYHLTSAEVTKLTGIESGAEVNTVDSVDSQTGDVDLSGTYAPIAKGVTNGDSHDHSGGDGAQINHTSLSNIGSNTHAQIDTHIANESNPHSVNKTQVGLSNVENTALSTWAGSANLNTYADFIIVPFSDQTTAFTTGTAKYTFTWPNFACTLTDISANVITAPTGTSVIIDVNAGGSTIMTTNKIEIEVSETSSETATTQPTLTTTAITANQIITIDIDQIGSTVAGAGGAVIFYFRRT